LNSVSAKPDQSLKGIVRFASQTTKHGAPPEAIQLPTMPYETTYLHYASEDPLI